MAWHGMARLYPKILTITSRKVTSWWICRQSTDPQGRHGLTTPTKGWDETLVLIRSNAAAVSGGGGGNSSMSSASTG